MNLAVRTAASPAGIWAIVVVAVVALGIWLGGMLFLSRDTGGRRRVPAGARAGKAWSGKAGPGPGGNVTVVPGPRSGAADDAGQPATSRTAREG